MRWAALACVLFLSAPVVAQVNYRPTDPPIVTAEHDQWYQRGEPVAFAGTLYYGTGPVVFFNGDVMVRVGNYNGVPLFVDSTIEPYSVVLVPIGHGLMRPYERIRDGDLAGTSGSRASSFPGTTDNYLVPVPIDTFTPYVPDLNAISTTGNTEPEIVGEESVAPRRPVRGKPFSYNSISIQYLGEKWVMAGPSGPLRDGLIQVGEYRDFPVYAERGRERTRVYLQIAPGRFAPFRPRN